MATIQIEIQANEHEQELKFEQDSITIGRGLGNDILIEDPQVSRYHARIVLEDGALVLYDLRSRNGTRVNTEKISSCPLRGDESIYIGQALLRARVSTKDSLSEEGDEKEEYRPTRHHDLSHILQVEDNGAPRETSIIDGEKSTVELAHAARIPMTVAPQPPTALQAEKETESALLPRDSSTNEPWRPFENCLAAVMPMIRDTEIESITITSTSSAYIKKNGQLLTVPIRMSDGQLQEALRIVSASVKPSHSSQASAPAFSIRLADGSELAGAGPALAPPSGVLVITTQPSRSRTIQDFLKEKILTQDMFYFLHGCVALRKTILVSGANRSTSRELVGVIADCIPNNQRITLLRGFADMHLPQTQVVHFGEQMSLSAAVLEAASRTRPDRMVLAESLQGDAVKAYIDLILNGCQGSIAHLRAPSAEAALSRIESSICQSDSRLPYESVRTLVREAIDIVVQVYELPNGTPRVQTIAEVVQAQDGRTAVSPVFALKQGSSVLHSPSYLAYEPDCLEELEMTGFEEAYRAFRRNG